MLHHVESFADVDVASLRDWICAIDFADWPQQTRLADGRIRPAMVTDLAWHDFGKVTEPLVSELTRAASGTSSYQRMLSVVMPGHAIAPHADVQDRKWLRRVHVPLVTNDRAEFIAEGSRCVLVVGKAYLVDTTVVHWVTNDGDCPRIHLMFDVRK